ncbi:MAG: hypothetical protein EXR95_04380 [Gemmatimonadetes bacterium]|nr:hypothetical protein [Gemmatimonadota bacterium]
MASHRNSVHSGARLRAFAAACDFNGDPLVIEPEFDDVSSFEVDLGKWTGRVVDAGTPSVLWEVARSADRASEGSQSARIRLDNRAGQAKVMLERRYEVEENQAYAVAISFQLPARTGSACRRGGCWPVRPLPRPSLAGP